MKSNSKFLIVFVFFFLSAGLIWEGCQNQAPSAAPLASTPVDQYSLMAFTAADLGLQPATSMVNTHLYIETGKEPPVNTGDALAEVSSYGMTPITVISGPLPFQLVPQLLFPDPQSHPYVATEYLNGPTPTPPPFPSPTPVSSSVAWPGAYIPKVIATGLTDSYDQYGISITGIINDPENPAYPPGAGNPDPIEFEYYPDFTGSGFNPGTGAVANTYDITPFQGMQFYVNVATIDDAVDRQFQVMTLQGEPGLPSGVSNGPCGTPGYPDLTHCFDFFAYDFTNTPRNQWVLIQKNWGDLKQYGFGSTQTPPTLSGTNLQQCVGFLWLESNAGTQGPITINFSLAGMRFF
jgi:hypothetical protein